LVEKKGPLKELIIKDVLKQLVITLHFMAKNSVVHRDMKPEVQYLRALTELQMQ
tara:strand:- start:1157 stop:1318 length:162 start_codon:yes stop_codon:yes gene_type:complete